MGLLEQFKSAVVGGSRKRRRHGAKHRRSKRGGGKYKLGSSDFAGGGKHKKSGKKSRKSRKSRKSHKKGGNMALKAAALPFSLLALQRLVGKKRSLKRRRSRR